MGEAFERSDGTATGNESSDLLSRVAVGAGIVGGVGAYLLGYLVTYLTQASAVRDRLGALNFVASLFGGDPAAAWQGVGWYFYNAHFVSTVVPTLGGGTRSVDLVASADASLGYLYLVPPVALLAAGAAIAFVAEVESPSDGSIAALGVVPAYFVLALVGAFLFAYGGGDVGSIHPDYVTAALLAGLVYPAVFGGIGGAVGAVVRSR